METKEDSRRLVEAFEKAMTKYIHRKATEKGKALIKAGKEVKGMGEYGLLQRPPVHAEQHMGRVAIYASEELPDDRAPENRRRPQGEIYNRPEQAKRSRKL